MKACAGGEQCGNDMGYGTDDLSTWGTHLGVADGGATDDDADNADAGTGEDEGDSSSSSSD